ncbi:MarR family transcriptional regulator [Lactococcus lactis]|uniref:zinc-dependent MarR family transcriptional regulator n=1 Tax=Lactococcus lactis TaxID=1358 RepID=UPI00223B4F56|nr:zinc-dependent MarR family transcriptional regulator [Lactococcus lactis]MCT1227700.1 MarR family transcriptional regulator [Lactococcus lactis]
MSLANQIDQFLGTIMQFAENKHEILLGKCESDVKLTSTQEHILMLLAEQISTNAKIAEKLKISPAAVTKALKKLQEQELIKSSRATNDERVVLWSLTEKAVPFAKEHATHHEKTLSTYQELGNKFTDEEQEVISKFLSALTEEFQ